VDWFHVVQIFATAVERGPSRRGASPRAAEGRALGHAEAARGAEHNPEAGAGGTRNRRVCHCRSLPRQGTVALGQAGRPRPHAGA